MLALVQGLMSLDAGGGSGVYLDSLSPQPLIAYGIKKLVSTATLAIRVRRSSDNAEQDIGFSGDALDTSALNAFVGVNSAFVVRFYDQFGTGNHLQQTTAAAQPRIVNSGAYEAAVVFNGTSQCMSTGTVTFGQPRIGVHARLSMPNQAGTAAIVETSPVVNSNNGSFLYFHSGNLHRVAINGTGAVYQRDFNPGNLSGLTVVSALAQLAVADGTTAQQRFFSSGTAISQSSGSGTAITPVVNFNNYSVFVGARNNASLFAPIRLDALAIYGADTSGVRSSVEAVIGKTSFAMWNPGEVSGNIALSGSNLVATRDASASAWRAVRATVAKQAGKWYFEVLRTGGSDKTHFLAGIMTPGNPLTSHPGQTGNGVISFGVQPLNTSDVNRYQNGFINTLTGQSDVPINAGLQFAIDADLGRGWVKTTGASGWIGGGDPAANTSPTFTWTANSVVFPAVGLFSSGTAATANFGESAFVGVVPSGFNPGWY